VLKFMVVGVVEKKEHMDPLVLQDFVQFIPKPQDVEVLLDAHLLIIKLDLMETVVDVAKLTVVDGQLVVRRIDSVDIVDMIIRSLVEQVEKEEMVVLEEGITINLVL
jgi:hypothetical protein